MALIPDAKLYGFGSHFQRGAQEPRDVDLLVLHRDTSAASIAFAIKLKSALCANVLNAHVVMLSEREERDITFIDRALAFELGEITSEHFQPQVSALCRRILQYSAAAK